VKKIFQFSMITLIFVMTFSTGSLAAVIGEYSDRAWYRDLFSGTTDSVPFEASYYPRSNMPTPDPLYPPAHEWPGWVSMIDLTLNAGCEGATWMYEPGAPGYADNVNVLTNGIDDVLVHIAPPLSWGYTSEHFWDYYAGNNGIDFDGFTIEAISFTLDEFTPINDPGAILYTVSIHGARVPIPGAMLLFGSGFVLVTGFRKFNRMSSGCRAG
jgi:hypothetical protein